ncbi:AAA family ATPase [Priestia megaterium]|uniref:AAA family ATPase n=1 Tax=Priestia megaterium TaxID=1404 RepID=UPI00300A1C05
MIFGLFVNGYKSYSSTQYIPICENEKYKFSTIVGRNGTGKSAILEVLNFFFKQGKWNENRTSKNKEDMFISPVFLIEKQSFDNWIESSDDFKGKSQKIKEKIDVISKYLWNESDDFFKGVTKKPYTEDFIKRKNLIKNTYSQTFYLLLVGKDTEFKSTLKPFSGGLKTLKPSEIDNINEAIENYYNYIYIPVEQHAYSTLKIENIQMQKIMNQDVVGKIEGFLNKKLNVDGRNKSFIEHINSQMATFVDEINIIIKEVDEEYEFKAKKNQRQNLRPSDIIENILEAYFVKRTLKVSNKELSELSSGEQRRALIDIIYAFLKNRGMEEKSNGRNVILAIDEPELSQDISHCFEQFERLEKLANEFGNQVLVTTHWYGILPVIENGTLLHISEEDKGKNESKFSVFDFYNYLDRKEHFPDDVQLKSLYDLAISLNTYMQKDSAKHMIICEGGTDKRYLETLIDPFKVKIVPVGGIDNVRNIYRLLVMPLQIEKKVKPKKKVLCLTDTDKNVRDNTDLLRDKSGNIYLRRLQKNRVKKQVELVNFDDFASVREHSVTRIEDVLHLKTWISVLREIIQDADKENNEIPFDEFDFHETFTFSNLRGDQSILFTKTMKADEKKQELIDFIESKKNKLSLLYVDKFNEIIENEELGEIPPLFKAINGFFKEDTLRQVTIKNGEEPVIIYI